MQKVFKVIITLALIAVIFAVYATTSNKTENKNEAAQIIRIHIRADDDSPQQQQLKQEVRDQVNLYLAPLLENVTEVAYARMIILENMNDIRRCAMEKLNECGSDMQVSVEFAKEYFPTRQYGFETYPAGEYEALIINIGSGMGQNWWCVAFPPLCYISLDQPYSDDFKYKSFIMEIFD